MKCRYVFKRAQRPPFSAGFLLSQSCFGVFARYARAMAPPHLIREVLPSMCASTLATVLDCVVCLPGFCAVGLVCAAAQPLRCVCLASTSTCIITYNR